LQCKLLQCSYRFDEAAGVDAATIEKKSKSLKLFRQEGKPEAMLDNIAR
jgi:hypothetical protein